MKKNYLINVTAYARVLVINAKSGEEATEIAFNEIVSGEMELDEASVVRVVPDEDIVSEKRHAESVITAD